MPMSECTNTEMRDLLPLMASGGSAALPAGLEAHLSGCAECRAELALIEAARSALSRTPAVDVARIARALPAYRPAGGMTDPLPFGIVDPPEPYPGRIVPIASRRRAAPAWRIAAAALILVGGAAALAVRQASDTSPAPVTIAGVEAVAPGGAGSTGPDAGSVPDAEPAASTGGSTTPAPRAASGPQMTFGGGLDDLSEEELIALLAALDDEDVLTPTEPEGTFPSLPLDGEEES